jgi:hypothetical protein
MTSLVQRARQLEEAFLGGLEDAQTAYEEIVATQAWTELGYDTFAEWWTDRVTPTMRALSMRPTKEIAASVVEQVRQEEAELPPAQRRRERELAEMVGATPDEVRDRAPRSTSTGIPTKVDHEQAARREWVGNRIAEVAEERVEPQPEPAADPLPPEIAEQIWQRIVEKATPEPIQPADPEVRERIAREREDQKMHEVHSRDLARCVWLMAERSRRVDAAEWELSRWRPDQDVYPEPTTSKRLRMAADFLSALAERWSE